VKRRLLAAAGAVIAVMAVPTVLAWAGGSDESDEVALLAMTADARSDVAFRGTVSVEWSDADGTHRKHIEVTGVGGWVELGDGQVAGTESERYLRDGNEWSLLWAAAPGEGPDPSDPWALSTTDGPDVAGRDVEVVEAADESGDVRARFSIDPRSGMMLRMDVLDADGDLERRVAFTSFTVDRSDVASHEIEALHGSEPNPVDDLPDPFQAPDELGDAYVRVGQYERENGEFHCFYSDGLFSASVFEQEGSLDEDELPPGAEEQEIDGQSVHVYRTPGGPLAVWEDDGVVFTVVADGPADHLDELLADLDGEDDDSTVENLVDTLTAPFRW
jgi:sigma-E factor negative regulatory protein RseB